MPPVSPSLLVVVVIVLLSAGFALGVFGLAYEEGQLRLRLTPRGRLLLMFDVRDTGFLLLLVISLGWSVAAAVEHSNWVTGSEKTSPAILIATLVGWVLAVTRVRRAAYLLLAVPGIAISLGLLLADQVGGGPGSLTAIGRWISAVVSRQQLGLLAGLLFLMMVSGWWTSWWTFRRRNGLVALLPTGTILAVEIINDPNPGLYFYTVFWLICAAGILLRLNFVALKQRWRSRRVPRAADTGWVFGEVGFEATALLLVVAFVLPPLTTVDISTTFLPGSISSDQFHPFGIGLGKSQGGQATVGYSETVRPGASLKAKSEGIMVVTGDSSPLYPYLRGIALGGWDGITWYQLPSTDATPVHQQPRLEPKTDLPREDLPTGSNRVEMIEDAIRILVPADQLDRTVFSAGEITRVDNHPTTVRGIATGAPVTTFGGRPEPINVVGPPVPFDTVDVVRLTDNPRPPYDVTVSAAVPTADIKSLRAASTDYPAWVEPYRQLYFRGSVAVGYSTTRDSEITSLALSIVRGANASTPYDEAKALEAWFRDTSRFTYTLSPPPAPTGVRPLDYFLFDSRKGYCQDFSTAMAVMLRSLNIPVRQMSGFSQGFFDEKTHRYLVNALNAHSWVEVYFPNLGWIPFEPTPDGTNSPIQRPATPADVTIPLPAGAGTAATPRSTKNLDTADQGSGSAVGGGFKDIWSRILLVAAGLLVLLLGAVLLMFRWLMSARDPRRIWRRLQFLADWMHVPRSPGDTPKEFGARLAVAVPPLDREVRALAELYTRANFRRGGLTRSEVGELQRSWHPVRRSYPGLVVRALRDRRRDQPAIRRGATSTSRSHGPTPPR